MNFVSPVVLVLFALIFLALAIILVSLNLLWAAFALGSVVFAILYTGRDREK